MLGLLAVMAARASASPMRCAARRPGTPAASVAAAEDADPPGSQPGGGAANTDGDAPRADAPRPSPDEGATAAPACGVCAGPVARPPPLASVVGAANRAAGLDDDPTPGWRRRARLSALVPRLGLRDGRDASWHDISDPTIGYVSLFSVAATWQLDRLVYDRDELRITSIATARRRERRRLDLVVVHAYYGWLRAWTAARRDPGKALVADEAAGVLDALTDGWFRRTLERGP